MIQIIGLVLLGYIAVLLTIFVFKMRDGIAEIKSLKQVISDKLKTKYEIVGNLSILEAQKKYIRFKSIVFEIIEEAGPLISNMIGVALGGKKGGGYREGS